MNRFFISPEDIVEGGVEITGGDAAHMLRVLRLKENDVVELCDGCGMEYTARIEKAEKQAVRLILLQQRANTTEMDCRITLYQALPKAGKLELIIQKCVELGVAEIIPMLTERCVVQPDGFEKKLVRLNKIAEEAAKQSRRGSIPPVRPLLRLPACELQGYDMALLAYEEEREQSLKTALRGAAPGKLALIIGPEGGFAPEEAALLQAKGAHAVTLGRRILRTETAGMAMLAMVNYELEG